jgi:NADPH-dependent curcumin reductase CurA
LSLDPYMRGRMNESKSYAQPQALGEVMIGGTVGEVVDSRHPKFKAGDTVVGMGGWQEFSVVDATVLGALRKVDTTHVPLSHYLGAVGMPGVTAWYGLVKIIAPKAGETVTVSAASGAVGALGGARIGSAVGSAIGPVGTVLGALSGALMGALMGGASGHAAGSAVGGLVDQTWLDNFQCLSCGHTFSLPAER